MFWPDPQSLLPSPRDFHSLWMFYWRRLPRLAFYTASMEDVKTPSKPLTVRVPEELHREARVLSVKRDEPLSGLIVKWLQAWVDHHKEDE